MKKLLFLLGCLTIAAPAAAQNPFSLINFGQTAVDTNSGNKSGGTLRVVLATDQPTPTNVFKIDLSGTGANSTAILVTGTGGTFPVTGTFWQATQPISAASLPLPSGASTAAKQPALGTAGSASSDVITVQGIASMTKLLVTPDLPALAATSTKQSDGSQKTQIVDGSGNVIASTSNNLNVQCANCSGSGASAADEATFTAGTSVFAPSGLFFQTTATNNALTNGQQGVWQGTAQRAGFVNLRNASGTEIGTSSTPVQVSLANTGANSNKLLVTPDSVALPANQSVNVSQMNGTTTSMNTGSPDSGTQRVVLADGASECAIVSAASTNATNCKSSAGNFFGYDLYNTTTTVYYLRLYNTSSAPTCSSATGFIRSIPVPPAGASGQVGGAIRMAPIGVAYGTGISFCLTGGSSSTDNTNAAVGIFGSVLYR